MAPAQRASPLRVGIILLAAVAAFAALCLAREVVLLGFLGVLVAVVLSFPVGWLARVIPRGLATIVVPLTVLGLAALVGLLAAPMIARELGELAEGYLVQPLVMRKAVEVKPALLLFGQGIFSAVVGGAPPRQGASWVRSPAELASPAVRYRRRR